MLEDVGKDCVRNEVVFTIYVTSHDRRCLFCDGVPYTLIWFFSVLPAHPPLPPPFLPPPSSPPLSYSSSSSPSPLHFVYGGAHMYRIVQKYMEVRVGHQVSSSITSHIITLRQSISKLEVHLPSQDDCLEASRDLPILMLHL